MADSGGFQPWGEPILIECDCQAAPQVTSVPDESAIFDAAIDICRKSDAIDEHAWNRGVLAVMSAFKACRAAIASGKSPAIPDGYVLVPKEITCAMDDAAWEAYHETRCMSDIWAALLAAAPQQEVK